MDHSVVSSGSEATAFGDEEYSPYHVEDAKVLPYEVTKLPSEPLPTTARRRISLRRGTSFRGSRASFATLSLFPVFARAVSMKVYHDKSGRKILPSSLSTHSKLLNDLHQLTGYVPELMCNAVIDFHHRTDNAPHVRKTALKLTHNTLSRLTQHTFPPEVSFYFALAITVEKSTQI